MIQLPTSDYFAFVTKIAEIEGFDCEGALTDQREVCAAETESCDHFYPLLKDLVFKINGKDIVLPPNGYTQNYSQAGLDYCIVSIQGVSEDMGILILGGTFLSYYTATFNYENNVAELRRNPLVKSIGYSRVEKKSYKSWISCKLVISIIALAVCAIGYINLGKHPVK